MFNSIRFVSRFLCGSIQLTRIKLNNVSIQRMSSPFLISNFNLSSLPKQKSEEYLHKLLESNQLPDFLVDKDHSELNSLISFIMEQFEYEMYRTSFELLETISNETNIFVDKAFQLAIYELKDILLAKDEDERTRMIRFFVSSKTSEFVSRHNKMERTKLIKKQREEFVKQINETQGPSGLWNFKNELVYGLWHNTMSIKCSRSSTSRLFDRKVLSASQIQDNPRVILDLDYMAYMDYFNTRRLGNQIRLMFAHNKYKTYMPFTIELCEKQTTSHFHDLMSRLVHNWNNPRQFQYELHQGQTVAELCPNPRSVYYICPSAQKVLTVDEVLNPEHVFVLPAYSCNNLRDPVFSKIISQMKKLKVNVRRLPATEHVVWNKFHGVFGLDTTFAILHDIKYDNNFDWDTVFRRYLTGEKIKSKEEVQDLEMIRYEKHKRRVQSIERSYSYQEVISKDINPHKIIDVKIK